MFSIGEFARLGAVSIRTLRHYDKIGLLAPAEVDPVTGYRSYSARQPRQLNRIVVLKDLGLTLGQIRRLLDGITVDELRGMLLLRRAQLAFTRPPASARSPEQWPGRPGHGCARRGRHQAVRVRCASP